LGFVLAERRLRELVRTSHRLSWITFTNLSESRRRLAAENLGLRHQLMAEAQSLVLDDRPVAPLYFNVSRYIVSPRVGGFVDNPADIHLSRSMAIDD
jgi:hypothetical protein